MNQLGDNNSAAKLDVVTKEQLSDAYRRSINNYNKYRRVRLMFHILKLKLFLKFCNVRVQCSGSVGLL